MPGLTEEQRNFLDEVKRQIQCNNTNFFTKNLWNARISLELEQCLHDSSPLILAIRANKLDMVDAIIQSYKQLDWSGDSCSLMYLAYAMHNLELLELLKLHNVNLTELNFKPGLTALNIAIIAHNYQAVEFLLQNGACPFESNLDSRCIPIAHSMALMTVLDNDKKIFKLLLRHVQSNLTSLQVDQRYIIDSLVVHVMQKDDADALWAIISSIAPKYLKPNHYNTYQIDAPYRLKITALFNLFDFAGRMIALAPFIGGAPELMQQIHREYSRGSPGKWYLPAYQSYAACLPKAFKLGSKRRSKRRSQSLV